MRTKRKRTKMGVRDQDSVSAGGVLSSSQVTTRDVTTVSASGVLSVTTAAAPDIDRPYVHDITNILGVGSTVNDLTKIVGAANDRSQSFGMALSHSQIPDATLEAFIPAQSNFLYHFAGMHWGSMFPTSVNTLSTTNETNVDEVIDFAVAHGLKIRWHALTWYFIVPSDIATALGLDFNGTHDTWFQWVKDKIAAKGVQVQSIEVFNEKTDATGIGYRDEVFTQAKSGNAVTCCAAQMERARLKFPTTPLSAADNCTAQGSDVFHTNAMNTLLGLYDGLIALDPAFLPDIHNEQAHVRGGQAYNQDRHARAVKEFMDRGMRYNYSEIDHDGSANARSYLKAMMDVYNDLGAGNAFGQQGHHDDGTNVVLWDSSYVRKAIGDDVLSSLVSHPVLTTPSYLALSNYSVTEPAGTVGTISALHPTDAALTFSVISSTVGSFSIAGGTTLNATGLSGQTTADVVLRAAETANAVNYKDFTKTITVIPASNLLSPVDFSTYTRPASVTVNGSGQAAYTATPSGQQMRKAFSLISGHRYKIDYTLSGITGGTFRIDLNNGTGTAQVSGTNRTTNGSYSETLTATASTTEIWFRAVVSAFTGVLDDDTLVMTDLDA